MFHFRRTNNRIDHIDERALKIIYQDYSSFKELLRKDKTKINNPSSNTALIFYVSLVANLAFET